MERKAKYKHAGGDHIEKIRERKRKEDNGSYFNVVWCSHLYFDCDLWSALAQCCCLRVHHAWCSATCVVDLIHIIIIITIAFLLFDVSRF